MKEQANNRTNNHKVVFFNHEYTFAELCDKFKISRATLNKFIAEYKTTSYTDEEKLIICLKRQFMEKQSKIDKEALTKEELIYIESYKIDAPKIIYQNRKGRYYKENGETFYTELF